MGRVSQIEEKGLKAAKESRELYMMIQGGYAGECLDQIEGKMEGDEMIEFQSLHTQRSCKIMCTGRQVNILAISSAGISAKLHDGELLYTSLTFSMASNNN